MDYRVWVHVPPTLEAICFEPSCFREVLILSEQPLLGNLLRIKLVPGYFFLSLI